MRLNHIPDRPQREGEIRPDCSLHRQGTIVCVVGGQSVPAKAHIRESLYMGPEGHAELGVGGADGEDAFLAAQASDPLAIALEIAVGRPAHVARMSVNDTD